MDQRQEMHESETGDAWIMYMICMDQRQEMYGSETGDA